LKQTGAKSSNVEMITNQIYQTHSVTNKTPVKVMRAIDGTYDKAFFVNPETGQFRFPNYNADNRFIVKIKDETNYRDLHWYGLSQEEKQSYGLKEFELFYMTPDVYVESFWEIFDKPKKAHLKPYQFLHEYGEHLRMVIEELENDNNAQFFEGDFLIDELIKKDFANLYEYKNETEKYNSYIEYINDQPVTTLKEICRKAGLKVSLKKQELADQIIQNKIPVEIPKPYILNDSFHAMMKHFYNLYMEDVKNRLDTWHPLYIADVWKEVKLQVECKEIEKMVDEIIRTEYWATRLREKIL
jgi:hypothetical protein